MGMLGGSCSKCCTKDGLKCYVPANTHGACCKLDGTCSIEAECDCDTDSGEAFRVGRTCEACAPCLIECDGVEYISPTSVSITLSASEVIQDPRDGELPFSLGDARDWIDGLTINLSTNAPVSGREIYHFVSCNRAGNGQYEIPFYQNWERQQNNWGARVNVCDENEQALELFEYYNYKSTLFPDRSYITGDYDGFKYFTIEDRTPLGGVRRFYAQKSCGTTLMVIPSTQFEIWAYWIRYPENVLYPTGRAQLFFTGQAVLEFTPVLRNPLP